VEDIREWEQKHKRPPKTHDWTAAAKRAYRSKSKRR
jgi:hypothetical protein